MDEMDRDELAITLAHEFVHQLDQKRWGLLFYGSYGLLFPVGRGARAVWERRAYAVDMLIAHERLGDEGLELLLLRLAALFSGPEYLWMWAGRRSAREFLESTAADVRSGVLATQHPYDLILAAWRGSEGESAK